MPAGYIKPLVVRISHSRFRYRFWNLMDKDLPVICYDTKRVIAGDSQFIKCHQIPWKDIQLVESERVIQPRGATINNSKPAGKRKRYTSVFGEKSKHNH